MLVGLFMVGKNGQKQSRLLQTDFRGKKRRG